MVQQPKVPSVLLTRASHGCPGRQRVASRTADGAGGGRGDHIGGFYGSGLEVEHITPARIHWHKLRHMTPPDCKARLGN